MKKLIVVLLTLVLALAACTTPEEPPQDDIAALEKAEKEGEAAGGSGDRADKDSGAKKEKAAPKKGGGRKAAQPADGGGDGGGGAAEATKQDGAPGGGRAPAAQAAAAPVPAGTYEYATQGERSVSGNEEPLPETTTLTAAAPADGAQRQTRDLRDSEGNGILTETDLLYRGGDVYLKYVKITARFQGGLTDVREFRLPRPQVIAPAGAGPGYTSGFTMEGSGTRAKVAIRALRYEDVTIAGRKVRALVVRNDIVFSGALEGYQRSTTWFLPKHLLALREQVDTDVRNGPVRLQSNYVATIRRVP